MSNTGASTPKGEEQVMTTEGVPLNIAETQAIGAIVAAYAGRDSSSISGILELTQKLSEHFGAHAYKQDLPASEASVVAMHAVSEPAIPAVEVSKSVTRDKIYCLCCGRGFAMLKRHLKAEHGLTEEQYRAKFDLPDAYPLVAPSYSERKAKYAKEVGLGKYAREKVEGEQPSPI